MAKNNNTLVRLVRKLILVIMKDTASIAEKATKVLTRGQQFILFLLLSSVIHHLFGLAGYLDCVHR